MVSTGWPTKFYVKKRNIMNDGKLSVGKAKEMLRHGEVGGKPLSKAQKGYFGVVASGKRPRKGY